MVAVCLPLSASVCFACFFCEINPEVSLFNSAETMDCFGGPAWRTPRPCDDYWSEFRHCKSFWNRFHHYYTYGTSTSCQQWKEDYHNCKEWEQHRTTEAKEALQMSERSRVEEQGKFSPVWKLRQDPPKDWHMPLNQEKPPDY